MMRSWGSMNIHYLYSKLVGAGFSFFIFIIFLIIQSSLNLYQLSEALTSPWLWAVFYVYGILSSFIIDWIVVKSSWARRWPLFLHIFAGFIVFFFVFGFWITLLVAGPIGAIAALLFYIGMKFVSKNKWSALIFAIILPLLLTIVSMTDFTQKKNWVEVRNEKQYEATFSYFNGAHKIPIQLVKGDELSFAVDFYASNDGGWGSRFEDVKGTYLPMIEHGDLLIYTADEDGEYYIVVGGNRLSGKLVVEWEIQH